MPSHRDGILLLSARPEAHDSLVGALSRTGVTVRVARHPVRALRLLLHRPSLVLVDLTNRALDAAVVSALNRARSAMVVLALDEDPPLAGQVAGNELVIDGFCRPSANPILHPRPARVATGTDR
jgi:DNA-binding response OmpR family regulator